MHQVHKQTIMTGLHVAQTTAKFLIVSLMDSHHRQGDDEQADGNIFSWNAHYCTQRIYKQRANSSFEMVIST